MSDATSDKTTPSKGKCDSPYIKQDDSIKDRALSMSIDKAIVTELWKYKLFKILLIGFSGMIAWSFIATILVFTAFQTHDQPYPIGIDSHGKIFKLTPLSSSVAPAAVVGVRVAEFLSDTFTFDYVHYKSQLNISSGKYFTPYGRDVFVQEMTKADGLLAFVQDNNAITSAISRGVPTLMGMGEDKSDGILSYRFRIFLSIDFKGASGKEAQNNYEIVTVVKRAPISEYEYGFAIDSISMRPVSAE